MKWVLVETLATKTQGRPVYLHVMTAAGPCCTSKAADAMTFKTKREAFNHRACLHPFCFFEPRKRQSKGGEA